MQLSRKSLDVTIDAISWLSDQTIHYATYHKKNSRDVILASAAQFELKHNLNTKNTDQSILTIISTL